MLVGSQAKQNSGDAGDAATIAKKESFWGGKEGEGGGGVGFDMDGEI